MLGLPALAAAVLTPRLGPSVGGGSSASPAGHGRIGGSERGKQVFASRIQSGLDIAGKGFAERTTIMIFEGMGSVKWLHEIYSSGTVSSCGGSARASILLN